MTLAIDLHAHTHHSDGTDSPTELLHAARAAGLAVVGITDHDLITGWEEAAAAVPQTGVALVRGVEITTTLRTEREQTVHLLSYLQDPTDPDITEALAQIREARIAGVKEMAHRLAVDYPISFDDVMKQLPPGATPGRPHIADALVQVGAFPDRAACFASVLKSTSRYYVGHWSPDTFTMIRLVREAGGVPVLAHPLTQSRAQVVPDAVIEEMRQAGLFGIEVEHREHDEAARRHVAQLAQRLDLAMFGSSDYHGLGKPNRLGENRTAESVLALVEQEGHVEVVRP